MATYFFDYLTLQMITKSLARFIHTGTTRWATEKSNLAVLRKKTGYTFANCKKALELHNNDIAKVLKVFGCFTKSFKFYIFKRQNYGSESKPKL